MFFLMLILGAVTVIATAFRKGPRAAAAAAFALSLVLPCFTYLEVGAVRIDVRTALAIVGIGCVLLHPQTSLRPRFLFADGLAVALVAAVIAAEAASGIVTLTVVFSIALGWLVPYWLGRIVWSNRDDVERLIAAVVPVCIVLAAWAAIESILRVNPVGSLLGHVSSAQSLHDFRWGLRRAEGPMTHPIFFGLLLVMLLPFALAAARKVRDGGPSWYRWMPWVVAGGAFFTMSRGPQTGILLTSAFAAAVLWPRWRSVIVAPIVIAVVVGLTASDTVLDVMHGWSGEKPTPLDINGEAYQYTGTTHRLLQLLVYSEAVEHADWLGYGTAALTAGHTTIPYVDPHLRQMFSSIDNHYLLFVLQCGFLGVGLFLALCATTIAYAWRAAARADGPTRVLAAALGGALLTLTLLMTSVWLPSDYRFPLLAVMGAAGGLRLTCVARRGVVAPAASLPSLALQLSPGHRVLPAV